MARVMVVTVFSFTVIGYDMYSIYSMMNGTPYEVLAFILREAVIVGLSLDRVSRRCHRRFNVPKMAVQQ